MPPQGGGEAALLRDLRVQQSELPYFRRLLGELRRLQTLEAHRASHLAEGGTQASRDATLTNVTKDVPMGIQGKDEAKHFEAAQAASLELIDLVFRAIFGDAQSQFASDLLEAPQFRGLSFTTATCISRTRPAPDAGQAAEPGPSRCHPAGRPPLTQPSLREQADAPPPPPAPAPPPPPPPPAAAAAAAEATAGRGAPSRRSARNGAGGSAAAPLQAKRRRQAAPPSSAQEELLRELDRQLAAKGFAALGFKSEEEVELYRVSKRRLMELLPRWRNRRSRDWIPPRPEMASSTQTC